MRLQDLLARLPGAELVGDPALEIADVTHDSRRASPGSLFVAIRGLVTDGNQFVDAARKKGAVAVCSEAPPRRRGGVGARRGRARGPRHALRRDPRGPRALARPRGRHRHERQDDHHLPRRRGPARRRARRWASSAPCEYRVGDRIGEAVRTTPESSDLQALFRDMVDAGCRRAVLEVSSHSLALEAGPRPRVRGRGLHEPHPRPPRLPRRHGRATSRPSGSSSRASCARTATPSSTSTTTAPPSSPRASRGTVWTYSLENPKADLLRRGRAPLARRHALPRAHARGRPRDRDAAPRPLQRAERARRARRRARPRPAPGRGAARDRRRSRACRAAWSA